MRASREDGKRSNKSSFRGSRESGDGEKQIGFANGSCTDPASQQDDGQPCDRRSSSTSKASLKSRSSDNSEGEGATIKKRRSTSLKKPGLAAPTVGPLSGGEPPSRGNYIADGNVKFYQPHVLAARARLRWSPKIRRHALRLWRVATLRHGRMDKFEYLDFHLSVYRWLLEQQVDEQFDEEDALAAGLEDWGMDNPDGSVGLTCDGFVVSLFQLADAWVDSAELADYTTFLQTLWQEATLKGIGGKRRWRHRWPPEQLAASIAVDARPTSPDTASTSSSFRAPKSNSPTPAQATAKMGRRMSTTWARLFDVFPLGVVKR